jgi:hypothetical protein
VINTESGQEVVASTERNEELLDLATRIYGNWSALKPFANITEEPARFWAASVDSDLRKLMDEFRKAARRLEDD